MAPRVVLFCMSAVLLAVAATACGSGNSNQNNGTQGGPAPVLSGPASRFAPFVEEMPGVFDVNPPETFTVPSDFWALPDVGPFTSSSEGVAFAEEHGYLDGWNVLYTPDGLLAGVAQGRYYATIQVFMFESAASGTAAYEAYLAQAERVGGSERVTTPGLGNRSSGWQFIQGTVGTTEIPAVYHRFLLQRGNLVAVVQTYGGEPFMSIDPARAIAVIIDGKALAEGTAIAPTPIPPPQGG